MKYALALSAFLLPAAAYAQVPAAAPPPVAACTAADTAALQKQLVTVQATLDRMEKKLDVLSKNLLPIQTIRP